MGVSAVRSNDTNRLRPSSPDGQRRALLLGQEIKIWISPEEIGSGLVLRELPAAPRPPERQRESRTRRLSPRFALRRSDYGSIFPKEKVRTSVPGGCWMCSTTFVYVRDVRRTVQFPFGHSVFALGGVGGGMFGEKVIWPL